MYSSLTSHGHSKSIKAVRRQRNLGLGKMIKDLKKTVENQNFENPKLHRRIDNLEA
jgi:F420-dependent methylenetetrahydromethanopterin dehydrogenase